MSDLFSVGGNAMVMHLWGENTASPMHSLHFGFGLGALLAPQFARPFLSPDNFDSDDVTTEFPTMTPGGANASTMTSALVDRSRIEIPYCIIGVLILAFSMVIFGFGIKGNPEGMIKHQGRTDIRAMFNPGSCARGNTRFGLELFICLFLYFIQAVGGERGIGKFLFSFAVEAEVALPKSRASNLQTTFWACHTGGRLLGIPLSKFVPVHFMIAADAIGALASALVLALLGHRNEHALWIGGGFMGLFIAICFPNGMTWANRHLDMNSMGVMVCMVGGAVGGFIYQYMGGALFERDPRNLMWVMVAYGVCVGVVFIAMETIVRVRRRKVAALEREQDADKAVAIQWNGKQ